eukprot:COSAG05_NODE_10434_length_566_cov_0.659529_1_plen_96_part_00
MSESRQATRTIYGCSTSTVLDLARILDLVWISHSAFDLVKTEAKFGQSHSPRALQYSIVRLPEIRRPRAWIHACACEPSEKEGAKLDLHVQSVQL